MKSLISLVKKIVKKEELVIQTDEHRECLSLLEDSSANVFLTGKAGTGKSTLIRYFREHTKKKVVVLAPTGLAALNVHGQTVHSFFRLPPRLIQKKDIRKVHNTSVYMNVDTIVIDEASMLRSDMLDTIDTFLRINGRDKNKPFGGVQMVLVGDLYQLPPIVSMEEKEYFQLTYETPYFFSADSFPQAEFELREFTTIFRQKEVSFIELLNRIRRGDVSMEDLLPINQRVTSGSTDGDHIILCPTNEAVNRINAGKLGLIDSPVFMYEAIVEGIFPTEERTLPVETELRLKRGARVLFLKNDKAGRWVNGTLGNVYALSEDSVQVRLDDTNEIVEVIPDQWENIRYEYDEEKGTIEANCIGKLTQYPLRLAWAVTIHKSQGMSFDTVCIDYRRSPFAHGQTYVALSRCRTLQGILLTRPIYPNDITIDEHVVEFHRRIKRA